MKSQNTPNETPADHSGIPRAATDENSGITNPEDTPPAEGAGVGPHNPQQDRERRGEGGWNRAWLVGLSLLVLVFIVLAVIGRVAGMF